MGLSKSLYSYKDCEDLCERAMNSPRGIRVRAPNPKYLRDRIYAYRKMQRAENRKIFAENEPLHGKTPYDELTFDIDGDTLKILNTAGKLDRYTIEDIGEAAE